MELRQLECFVKTAELGSFTKAAALLHISQPALSKSIHLLEQRLGTALFDRKGKKVSLNATGLTVLEHAQRILNECHQIEAFCGGLRETAQKTITLRMMAASEHLPKLLSGFRQIRPDISIVSLQAAHEMDQSDTDILVYASRQPRDYALDKSVLREPLALAVPEGHPLFSFSEVTFAQLGEHYILSLRVGNDMRRLEDHYFSLAGISPHREIECDTPATLRSLIVGGFGIALVPTVTWRSMHTPKIKLLPISGLDCARYINISIPSPDRMNRDVADLFRYMSDNLESIARNG